MKTLPVTTRHHPGNGAITPTKTKRRHMKNLSNHLFSARQTSSTSEVVVHIIFRIQTSHETYQMPLGGTSPPQKPNLTGWQIERRCIYFPLNMGIAMLGFQGCSPDFQTCAIPLPEKSSHCLGSQISPKELSYHNLELIQVDEPNISPTSGR